MRFLPTPSTPYGDYMKSLMTTLFLVAVFVSTTSAQAGLFGNKNRAYYDEQYFQEWTQYAWVKERLPVCRKNPGARDCRDFFHNIVSTVASEMFPRCKIGNGNFCGWDYNPSDMGFSNPSRVSKGYEQVLRKLGFCAKKLEIRPAMQWLFISDSTLSQQVDWLHQSVRDSEGEKDEYIVCLN